MEENAAPTAENAVFEEETTRLVKAEVKLTADFDEIREKKAKVVEAFTESINGPFKVHMECAASKSENDELRRRRQSGRLALEKRGESRQRRSRRDER